MPCYDYIIKPIQHTSPQKCTISGLILLQKIITQKEKITMSVIITLNGIYIATTYMTTSEIRNAEL